MHSTLNEQDMVTRVEKIFFIVAGLIILAMLFFWRDISDLMAGSRKTGVTVESKKETKEKRKEDQPEKAAGAGQTDGSEIAIRKRWDLPSELREVSGIAYIDARRFACIQDEEGSLYIFNTETNQIERKLRFAGKGDFEDLALAENTAYVLRSDGVIFEIDDYNSDQPGIKKYTTHLTAANDCEGLVWDKKQNRLLVTVKNAGSKEQSPVYSFDLAEKKMAEQPAFTIDFDDPVFEKAAKKKDRRIRPSAIGIHPTTGDLYVLEGTSPKLLILDQKAAPQKLVVLDKADFPQPEGLSFSPAGDLFISNEGGKSSGTILHVATKP